MFFETGDPDPIDVEGCEVGARPRPSAACANAGDAKGGGMEACWEGIWTDPIGSAETFGAVELDNGAPAAVAALGTLARTGVPPEAEPADAESL